MSKHLQLSIAEPCHENWDNMTPADKGRFCNSCQKQVVDFSNMSDRQIAEFFKKPSLGLSKGGSVCGRFMQDQLERDIEIPRKRIPWLKYFFQFVIPAFLVSMKATAQGQVKVAETSKPIQKPTCTPLMGTVAAPVKKKQLLGDTTIVGTPPKMIIQPDLPIMGGLEVRPVKVKPVKTPVTESILLRGRVVDENGEPIPQATILVVNSKASLAADDDGNFSLNAGLPSDMIQLEVSSIGYKTEIYNYPYTFGYTSLVNITVQLVRKSKEMDEVVVAAPLQRIRMGGVMRYTVVKSQTVTETKKDSIPAKEIKTPIVINKMLVYPNPVSSGMPINISFKKPEEGYYLIQIVSQFGQLVHQKEIWIGVETVIGRVEVPYVASGSYFLTLLNKKSGKKFTEKLIIQ